MAGLELLSDQGYRVDGRRAGELRKIQARMGVFSQADGSAYIEQGNTKALAVVYGPHEASGRRGPGDLRGEAGGGQAEKKPRGDGQASVYAARLGGRGPPEWQPEPRDARGPASIGRCPLRAPREPSPRCRLQRLRRTSPDAFLTCQALSPARARPALLRLSPQTPIPFLFLCLPTNKAP